MIIERNANIFDNAFFRDIQRNRLYLHLTVVQFMDLYIRLEQKVRLKTDGLIFIEDNLFQTSYR